VIFEPTPPASPSQVLLADDHPLVRSALKQLLEGRPDLKVVGEATDGREAVELCRRLRPDMVLMDVRMPHLDGLQATRRLKEEQPRIIVLILTALEDPDNLFEATKAGAAGYVLKHASQEELLGAIYEALDGEFPLDRSLVSDLLKRVAGEYERLGEEEKQQSPLSELPRVERLKKPVHEALTPREREILNLLAQGRTNRDIARRLTISPGTAKLHVHHVIKKLGVSDRTQAALHAIRFGLTLLLMLIR
jgi:DNA-binding NarL/FixJ family response regulator